MPETEPLYFKEFRKHIDTKFAVVDTRFDDLEKKIETEINDLAVITAKHFVRLEDKIDLVITRVDNLEVRFDGLEKKVDHIEVDVNRIKNDIIRIDDNMAKIEGHIGRYEIRSQNIEQILLQEHRPRIAELERTVFS